MPKTAAHLGLKPEEVNDPEKNIRAAAQLIKELTESFSDVKNVEERKRFVLASYNGGSGHIRDAMALTTKQGGNPQRWADVAERLLLLREPEYYNDPVVKHGYIRSTETHDYVELILERYKQYRRSAPLRR
jgi:membrane-bound lytic murein transglycosylase F